MANKRLIKEIILERNSKAIFLEKEFDEALLGSAIPVGQKHVAIYDSNRCIEIVMDKLELNELDALSVFQITTDYTQGTENSPILFSDFSKIKEPVLPIIKNDMTIDDLL